MGKVKSSKPKKQRKGHYSKALHRKQDSLAAHLDKALKKKYRCRHLPVRKGDTVKVLRGSKKGNSGKITAVDYSKGVVFIDKLTRKKANGEEIALPVHASNLVLTDLDKSDAKRLKGKASWKAETKEQKESEKAEKKDSEGEKAESKASEAKKAKSSGIQAKKAGKKENKEKKEHKKEKGA